MADSSTHAQEWRKGWAGVVAAMVGMGAGAGLYQYVSSLFIAPLEQAFGWSRGEIATAAAIGLLGALSAPLLGRLADRHGARAVAVLSLGGLGAAFAGMAFMSSYPAFMLFSAVIGIFAPGCTAMTFARYVNARFDRSLGLALGVMMAGLSVSAFLVTLALQPVLDAYGHRGGYLLLAGIAWGLGIPAAWLGRPRHTSGVQTVSTTSQPAGASLAPLLRQREFVLLALAMFAVNVPASGVVTQLRPMIGDKVSGSAGFYVALYALSVLAGRLLVGAALDRFPSRLVAACSALAGGMGCLLLLEAVPGAAVPLALCLIGLLQGAEADVLAYLVTRYFPRTLFGSIYGLLVTVSLFGTAAGIYLFGTLFDRTGTYDTAIMVAVTLLLFAAMVYLRMPQTGAANQQTSGDPA